MVFYRDLQGDLTAVILRNCANDPIVDSPPCPSSIVLAKYLVSELDPRSISR